MFIEINPGSPVAVYEQVVMQIKFAIATGAIREGEMIPSIRDMAKRLAINPNTVARAWRILQDDGTVFFSRGSGLTVAQGATEKCKEERRQWFEKRFSQLIGEALQCGLSSREIVTLVESELTGSDPNITK